MHEMTGPGGRCRASASRDPQTARTAPVSRLDARRHGVLTRGQDVVLDGLRVVLDRVALDPVVTVPSTLRTLSSPVRACMHGER